MAIHRRLRIDDVFPDSSECLDTLFSDLYQDWHRMPYILTLETVLQFAIQKNRRGTTHRFQAAANKDHLGCAWVMSGGFIDPRAVIQHQVIVFPGARVGQCRVSNSIVLSGAHIGDGSTVYNSIIGREARLGANIITYNTAYDARSGEPLEIHPPWSYARSTQAHLMHLGALIGDHVQLAGGTVTMPGAVVRAHHTTRRPGVVQSDFST